MVIEDVSLEHEVDEHRGVGTTLDPPLTYSGSFTIEFAPSHRVGAQSENSETSRKFEDEGRAKEFWQWLFGSA